jgi:hypothetical protein
MLTRNNSFVGFFSTNVRIGILLLFEEENFNLPFQKYFRGKQRWSTTVDLYRITCLRDIF